MKAIVAQVTRFTSNADPVHRTSQADATVTGISRERQWLRPGILAFLMLCLTLPGPAQVQSARAASAPATSNAARSTAAPATILIYGDSLSAAYGISQKDGWTTLLQDRLKTGGGEYSVANASISGETSSGGASRIRQALVQHKPKITVLALGANDGLRGLPVKQMRANLETMIRAAQQAGSKVVLVGMQLPPNYGPAYTREFRQSFTDIARQYKLPLVPFLLEGMADKPDLFQPDQLHPTAAAQPRLLENVWSTLKPLL